MPAEVRCADCGFLSWIQPETRELVGCDQYFRNTGGMANTVVARSYDSGPICFARAVNLKEEADRVEVPDRDGPGTSRVVNLAVLNLRRNCPKFVVWHQGFTPKEHAEMVREEEQSRRDHEWRKEDLAIAREAMRVNIWTCLFSAVVGFVAALAAVFLERMLNRN